MLSIKKLLTKILTAIGFYSARSASTSYGTLYVQRIFNVVTVTFEGTTSSLTHSAYNKLFTLNSNERPPVTVRFVPFDNNTSDATKSPLAGYINTSGEAFVWIYGNSVASHAPRFTATFVKPGGGYPKASIFKAFSRFREGVLLCLA